MKNSIRRFRMRAITTLYAAAALGFVAVSSHAASDTWTGSSDAVWTNSANWLGGGVPSAASDIATFSGTSANTTIDLGSGVTNGLILFDTSSAAAYTIGSGAVGSQTLTFITASSTNAITLSTNVVNNQTINANILANTADNTLRLINNSTNNALLTINGTISGGTGTTARTVNTTGNVTLNGAVTPGSATSIALANTGTGTLTLSGSGTSTLSTLRAAGGSSSSKVLVAGQTVNVSSSSSQSGTLEITSGTLSINGALSQASTSADLVGMWRVGGGTFSASSVTVARNYTGTSLPSSASTTAGFIVDAGVATITGSLSIGTSNSGAQSRMSGGSLTVQGTVALGGTTSNRYSVFQISGGTFYSTDTANGVRLSIQTGTANYSELLLTGGTSTIEKVSFGATNSATNSQGYVVLNGAGAELYMGNGGMNLVSTNPYNAYVHLTAGTLGAKTNWSSSLGINLNGINSGTGLTIKAADASGVAQNITLSGSLTNTGGFTKTGGGTLTLSGANTYSGATIISNGVLSLQSANTVSASTINVSGGTLEQTVDNAISGTAGLTVSSGSMTLLRPNSYSGATTVTNTGSILLGNASAITNSTLTVGVTNGVSIGTGITAVTVGGLAGVGDLALTNADSSAVALTIGNNNANATFSGVLSGGGSLTKIGTGTQTLSGTNGTYTGGTTIKGGMVTLNNAGAIGTNTVTFEGGTLKSGADYVNFNTPLFVGSGQTGTLALSQRTEINGTLTGAGTLNVSAPSTTGGTRDYWDGLASAFTGTINISGGGGLELRQNGGDFDSFVGATVNIDNEWVAGSMASVGGTIKFGALSGTATARLNGSSYGGRATFEVGAKNLDTTFAGIIADGSSGGALTKVGTGTLTLSGTNSYTGTTTVSAGALIINGNQSAATGAMSVASGATLGGSGTIGGATTINGIHSPGNSPGIQTFTNDLAYGATSVLNWELISNATATRGTDFDGVNVGGNISITSGALINLVLNGTGSSTDFSNAFWNSDQSWLVLDLTGAGTTTGNFAIGTVSLDSLSQSYSTFHPGGSFSTSVDLNNDVYLNWTAVPEPSTYALLVLSGAGFAAHMIRRRKRA